MKIKVKNCEHFAMVRRTLLLLLQTEAFHYLNVQKCPLSEDSAPGSELLKSSNPVKKGDLTWVSVTLSSFAISDRSLLLRYFFISNCFSNSNICRPVKVVLAFFFLDLASVSSEVVSELTGVVGDDLVLYSSSSRFFLLRVGSEKKIVTHSVCDMLRGQNILQFSVFR